MMFASISYANNCKIIIGAYDPNLHENTIKKAYVILDVKGYEVLGHVFTMKEFFEAPINEADYILDMYESEGFWGKQKTIKLTKLNAPGDEEVIIEKSKYFSEKTYNLTWSSLLMQDLPDSECGPR